MKPAPISLSAVVRKGHWLYAGQISCEVKISRRNLWPGSGDLEDCLEIGEDREGECYELEFQTPAGKPEWNGGGYYASIHDAAEGAQRLVGETLQWED